MKWLALVCMILISAIAFAQTPVDLNQLYSEIDAVSAEIRVANEIGREPAPALLSRLTELEREVHRRGGDGAILDQGGETCDAATIIPSSTSIAYCAGGILGQTDDCTLASSCGTVSSAVYRDVFYSFIPQTTGLYLASMCGSVSDTWLRVWSGTCCTGTQFTCDNDSCGGGDPRRSMTLTAGTTYYFECGYRYSNQPADAYGFNLFGPLPSPAPVPANDICSQATTLAIPSVTAGTTRGAGNDTQAQVCDGTAVSSGGVWYRIEGNGHRLTARTQNNCSTFDTRVRVYRGDCTGMVCVGGNDNIPAPPSSALSSFSWCSDIGTVYYVIVSNSSTYVVYRGPFTLEILEGDICSCTAIPVCDQPAETEDNSSCEYYDAHLVYGNDTFYGTHCPTSDLDFYRVFVSAGSVMTLTLFDGAACAVTPAGIVRMSLYDANCNPQGTASNSTLTVNRCGALTDTMVYVSVFDAESPGINLGPYKITTVCTPPMTNDRCTDAIPVGIPSQITGSTAGCVSADHAPVCSGIENNSPGVWYRVTGNDHRLTATTCNDVTNFDTRLSVFTGACDGLICVSANDDDAACPSGGVRSSVTWNADMGVDYWILVHGGAGQTGAFRLDVADGPSFHMDCAAFVACGTPSETEPNNLCPSELDPALLACGPTLFGTICPPSDVDYFGVTVPPMTYWTVNLFDGSDCTTQPSSVTAFDLLDPSCTVLVGNQHGRWSLSNSTADARPLILKVYGDGSREEKYRLSITCGSIVDYCAAPIIMGTVFHFQQTVNTCLSTDIVPAVFVNSCVEPSTPSANDALFKFTLQSIGVVSLAAAGTGDNQLMLLRVCGDTASCVASADQLGFGHTETLPNLTLQPGVYYVSVSLPGNCGEITLTADGDVPLPVVMLGDPMVTPGDGAVTISWVTASELENDHFEIVRDRMVTRSIPGQGSSAARHSYEFTDRNLTNGVTYHYLLRAVSRDGSAHELSSFDGTPRPGSAIITQYSLYQNFPNPFNPTTGISFDVLEAGQVSLKVYDMMGSEVAIVTRGQMTAGHHTVGFDGSRLSTGIYFYRLEVNGYSSQKKMLLIK
jgi:hypothetical protein